MAYTKTRCVLAWAFLLLYPGLGKAEDALARLTVLALAPVAGQAVVQGPDGSLHLVRLDDQLPGHQCHVGTSLAGQTGARGAQPWHWPGAGATSGVALQGRTGRWAFPARAVAARSASQ